MLTSFFNTLPISDGNDNPVCETAKETQMCRVDFWTLETERERVGWFGRMALKHVYYQVRIESPVYVQCRIQHAWGRCTGMTQRDVVGREVRGGFMFVFFVVVFQFFILTLFYFTILYWFCHTLTWIHHGCTCIPKLEPPPATSLPITSLWVITVHQHHACCILRWT